MSREKHEHHSWLLAILLILAIALLAIAGVFGYHLFYGETVRTVKRIEFDSTILDRGAETQQQIVNEGLGLAEESQNAQDLLSSTTFQGSAIAPGFSYPNDWHIFSTMQYDESEEVLNNIFVDAKPIRITNTPNENPPPIDVTVVDLNTFELFGMPTYANWWIDAVTNEFVDDVEASSKQIENGTLTTITAKNNNTGGGPLPAHDFTYLIYETKDTGVAILYRNIFKEPEVDAAWEIVKNSLDFSLIQ